MCLAVREGGYWSDSTMGRDGESDHMWQGLCRTVPLRAVVGTAPQRQPGSLLEQVPRGVHRSWPRGWGADGR